MKNSLRRRLLVPRFLTAAVLLFTLCFLATTGVILWELRRQTWSNAVRAGENLVAAVSQDIGRNIELYDLSLQAVVDGLRLPDIDRVSPETRQAILFDRAATAQYLGSILVLNEHGQVVEDAGSLAPRPENFADRTYFTVHRDRPDAGLYVSEPFRRRLTGPGDWVIAFSRRVDKPDGSFGGVVSGTLRLDYFRALFTRFQLGTKGAVTLFRADGTMLVRAPYDDGSIGRRFVGTEIMRRLQAERSGQFVGTASLDGVTRAINFTHVADLPLILIVAQSPEDILAGWNRWAAGIVAVLTAMCLAVALLATLCQGELRRRFRAEAETRRREEELRLIADHATDVIVRLDASLVRRYVSPSSLDVFGYAPAELVGKDFRATMHPEDREQAELLIEQARRTGGRRAVIYRILRKDGAVAWVEGQFSAMPGEGFTVLLRDISARKAAEGELALVHDELRRMAVTDGLTGLANRRRFDEVLAQEWRRAAREGQPLTLLLLDVDRFKQFNDRYGHQEGDACLRLVAKAVAGCARRPADLVARYGGEEIAVILPDTDDVQARRFAERVRKVVQALAVPHGDNALHGSVITASLGSATTIPGRRAAARDAETDMRHFVVSCDRALYAAKEAGRNRVAAHEAPAVLEAALPAN